MLWTERGIHFRLLNALFGRGGQGSQMNGAVCSDIPRTRRIKIIDLNPHLMCVLCGGYYIDATTIIECLHSFCKTCIVGYLETSKFCPICDVQVHKTKPLLNIRSDQTLQDIVYKLVPGLFHREMKRRRDFYAKHPQDGDKLSRCNEDRGEVEIDGPRNIFMPDEFISIALEYSESGGISNSPERDECNDKSQHIFRRYLRCPVFITVAHIKKLIRAKYNLTPEHRIDILFSQDNLNDDFMLMDIVYTYAWKRKGPLKLFFRIFERPQKRLKTCHCRTSSPLFGYDRTKNNLQATGGAAAAAKRLVTSASNDNATAAASVNEKKLNGPNTSQQLQQQAGSEENGTKMVAPATTTTLSTTATTTATTISPTVMTPSPSCLRVNSPAVASSHGASADVTPSLSPLESPSKNIEMAVVDTNTTSINNNNNNTDCLSSPVKESEIHRSRLNNEESIKPEVRNDDINSKTVKEICKTVKESRSKMVPYIHRLELHKKEGSKPMSPKYNLSNGDVRIHLTPIRVNDNRTAAAAVTEKLNGGMTSPTANNNKIINKIDRKDIIASN